jgi:hypothetical protein
MKKIIFTIAALLSVSSVGLTADTASVLSCYKQAYSQKGPLNLETHAAVTLCAQVDSSADVSAVLACASKAIKMAGLDGSPEDVALLCSSVH